MYLNTSRILYDSSRGVPARWLGANSEYYDTTAGKLLSTSKHRIVRRELDERAERNLQLSSYPLAAKPFLARLPVPLSVAITWAGAGLSLALGLFYASRHCRLQTGRARERLSIFREPSNR